MKKYIFLGLFLLWGISGFAQFYGRPPMRPAENRPQEADNQSEYFISGQVFDEKNEPMVAVSVRLLAAADSSLVAGTGTMTDDNGKFIIKNLKRGEYLVNISFLGYKGVYKPAKLLRVQPSVALGSIKMEPDAVLLGEAVVSAVVPPIVAKEDTLEYNADSYKTQPNAVVEDMFKKLPGVEVDEDGKITVQGKEVKKILIDGEEFFTDDPKIASKNLPANMVEKIQVVDRKSDEARFSGVDDGEEETVINLTVKKGMKQGWFGVAQAGGGTQMNEFDGMYEVNGSLLFPRKFYEIDALGKVVHYSPYNGKVLPGYMFTDTGFWDTFRSLFPFLNLMYPTMSKEMQEGLINAYKESGFFPEWASPGHRGCMVGNNSASVLVDAYVKGIKVDDLETLYKGLIHGTENVHPTVSSTGRLGHEYYNKLGYVPYDVKINENAARTLEYAYNDWCIYQIAKDLGRPKKELDLYAKRAMNYKNLFDKETKLMRGKNKDGNFMTPFSPLKWGDAFTEGNSWHYTWSVFHDPQGLIDLMGGRKEFITMLDSVFAVPPVFDDSYYGQVIHEIREMQIMNMGNYAHGNQPIQHMIYLYNYAGEPWKAQYWLRQVMDRMYTPTPDGYCGDEDNGQTSAWYVFSALGFYPVAPGTTQYVLGAPLFKKATLHFENGKSLVVNAPENSDKNIYIESMSFNGKNYTKNYLEHFELLKGGVLDIKMGDEPNMNRGVSPEDFPYSFSVNEKQKK